MMDDDDDELLVVVVSIVGVVDGSLLLLMIFKISSNVQPSRLNTVGVCELLEDVDEA